MLSFIIYKVALGKNHKRISGFGEGWVLRILLCTYTQSFYVHTVCKSTHCNHTPKFHGKKTFSVHSFKSEKELLVMWMPLWCIFSESFFHYPDTDMCTPKILSSSSSSIHKTKIHLNLWILYSGVHNIFAQYSLSYKLFIP